MGAVQVKETDVFPKVPVNPVGAFGIAMTLIAFEFAETTPVIVSSVSTAR